MAPTIRIAQGKLAGALDDGIQAFRGVPYATAPRFAPPGPAPTWSGTREATDPGPQSPQIDDRDERFGRSAQPQAEDCLSLNIWHPADAEGLPVMVFIHGGGFQTGGGGHPCYDGATLARRGQVVVVTLQYRLGVLGLLWHPALGRPDAEFDGNWCMQDLLAGLRWVHDNISAFGGDAGNLTLFGESAGGVAVAQLCLSPAARPLIRRAVIQSASPNAVGRAQHEAAAATFLSETGSAADAEALRALPLEAVLAAQPAWAGTVGAGRPAPRPMVDGKLLPDWPNAIADSSQLAGLDIMVSYCRDEYAFMACDMANRPTNDDALFDALGRSGYPPSLLATYREARRSRGQSDDALSLWIAIQTDALIRVPALDFLARHSARGGTGYACAVTWESTFTPAGFDRPLGACHTIELPLLFGRNDASPTLARLAGTGAEAAAVSTLIQDAWIAFARTGSPATPATGDWPGFAAPDRATMCLNNEARLEHDPWGDERAAMQGALAAIDAAA
ncbi:MAG: carboxylesterase family protein [Alphaproteobacteria bacterium]